MSLRTILSTPHARQRAKELIDRAPEGHISELREPRRTNAQNDLLWALLTEVSRAKPDGRDLPPEIWKALFMDALDGAQFKARWEPSLDGQGVVNTGHRSSKLSKSDMSDLIESIRAFCAERGIELAEQEG